MRKSWDEYYLGIAFQVSERSTCSRRAVGAIVVKDRRIKGTGYNGSPSGLPHCLDEGCYMIDGHCLRCIHAEPNALLECAPDERVGATLYCTDRPCPECQKLIITCGIKRIVFSRNYHPHIDWFQYVDDIEVIEMSVENA
ncbi:MAG: cytidine/deoxycytidylate deaminase family protein [Bacillota bacterium]